jgi:tRNA(Ile)-lysidine synthase
MIPLAARVARTIRRRELTAAGDRVAVALSGGPDSVALTWLLRDLARDAAWGLAGLIHVNHGLRGEASDADGAFCRSLATRLDLPIVVTAVDVRQRARERHESIEAAARSERYRALSDAAITLGATLVATGHTMDDQAETVLLRLFRGTGSRGLAAIRPRRGIFVRPLIDVRRTDLAAYLAGRAEAAQDDASNRDETVPRNRLRHAVLPLVARDWPGAVPALARFAELAADDERFLSDTAREVTPAMTIPGPGGVQQIDARGVSQLPAALSRRIIRSAIESGGGTASFRDIERVRALARSRLGTGHLDLNGLSVEKQGWAIRFGEVAAPGADGRFEYALTVPGIVEVSETGTSIQASIQRGPLDSSAGQPTERAVLQASAVQLPLTVRNRRPGDRIHPFGAPGSRKLQDLFVDRKVPTSERDRVPLVVDAKGWILWVVGHAIAEPCRVTAPESGMVILESKKGNQ